MSFISKQLKSQIVTASGSPAWTRPANVDAVMLTVVGGGGGGGAAGGAVGGADAQPARGRACAPQGPGAGANGARHGPTSRHLTDRPPAARRSRQGRWRQESRRLTTVADRCSGVRR